MTSIQKLAIYIKMVKKLYPEYKDKSKIEKKAIELYGAYEYKPWDRKNKRLYKPID